MNPEYQNALELLTSITNEVISPLMNQMLVLTKQIVKNTQSLDWTQLIFFIVINAIVSFLAVYYGAYWKKKAVNQATVEDIEKITIEIQKVRAEYQNQINKFSESLKFTNQLKMAALDKKLDIYQEAYVHWINMIQSMNTDKTDEQNLYINNELDLHVQKAREWWDHNCLFLADETRQAFNSAVTAGIFYTYYLNNVIKFKAQCELAEEIGQKRKANEQALIAEKNAIEAKNRISALGGYLTRDVGVLHLGKNEYDQKIASN